MSSGRSPSMPAFRSRGTAWPPPQRSLTPQRAITEPREGPSIGDHTPPAPARGTAALVGDTSSEASAVRQELPELRRRGGEGVKDQPRRRQASVEPDPSSISRVHTPGGAAGG